MSDVTILLLTSSAVTLGGGHASYQNVFSPLPVNDGHFFDEGPRIIRSKTYTTASSSGSIDTSAIDAFTQGVEITNQARYDAGLVKIWSGEPGHRLLRTRFGEDRTFSEGIAFVEMDVFNVVRFMEAGANPLQLPSYILGDEDQTTDFNFNGVLEPFTIRGLTSYEEHAIHGSLVGGNTSRAGSEQVLSVDAFSNVPHGAPYVDTANFSCSTSTSIMPFTDQRLVRNTVPVGSEPGDMVEAMSLMTGSTDNYVSYLQRSSTCGWDYDNAAAVGTDTLPFGGMTY